MIHPINQSPTWYDATLGLRQDFPTLEGKASADVCVIGGGLAGLTTALELARKGKSVVLLEANRIACGASGRNGGFVSSGFAESFDNIVKTVGLDEGKRLHEISRMGTDYVRQEILRTDPSIKMGDGMIVMQRYRGYRDDGGLRAYAEKLGHTTGEKLNYLDTAALREKVDSARYFCGFLVENAFHMHPLRYALMLASMARNSGAQIFELSPALSVRKAGGDYDIITRRGSVLAQHVVHCVSSLDRRLHRLSARAVLPIATYIAVTEPLEQADIKTSAALIDTRRAGNYYRLLPDNRLLWGGHITTSTHEPADLAMRMQKDIVSAFPRVGKVRIDYRWAGLMGYAVHKMPLIGHDGEGQWFATAFGGHGMNTTAMAGNLIAQAIADGDDTYRRFAKFAPRWAFGQFGRIGVQGAYWWMQIKDRIDERQR